jgi:YidC/Oxa1 family membrane protein insertase
MELWNAVVFQLAHALVALGSVFGGNLGLAIITVSLAMRLLLLPLSLRMMRRAEAQRRKLAELQPDLDRLARRFADDPERRAKETWALYRRRGVNPLDGRAFVTALAQVPVMAALSSAIRRGLEAGGRFLWVEDLARPDAWLALGVAALAAAATVLAPGARDNRTAGVVLSAALTLFFAWKLSAGLGLYWAVSSGVGLAQSAWLRRRSPPT